MYLTETDVHYGMLSLRFLCLVHIGFQDNIPIPLYGCVAGNVGICPLKQTLVMNYGQALLLLWLRNLIM